MASIDETLASRMVPFWSDAVIRRACELWGLSRAELLGPSRVAACVRPRHAVCWVLHHFGMSYHAIARRIERTDHTTAVNAIYRAGIWLEYEPGYAEAIAELVDAACPGASADLPFALEEAA